MSINQLVLNALQNLSLELQQQSHEIKQQGLKLDVIGNQQLVLQKQIKDTQESVASFNVNLNSLSKSLILQEEYFENVTRERIIKMFGESYAKARSFRDIITLVSKIALLKWHPSEITNKSMKLLESIHTESVQ